MNTVIIESKEWFDRMNGNSYFSAHINIDGEHVYTIPFQYGYGQQFEYEAERLLKKQGIIPADCSMWAYFRENNIIYNPIKHERCLKRDVLEWGTIE